MEISDEERFTPRNKMDEESSKMEFTGLSSRTQACRAVRRPKKRWEDDINQVLKPGETEKTKGNDLKKTTTHGSGQHKTKKDGQK